MYKAILVDDDEFVLKGFQQKISWESLDVKLMATAKNGSDALTLVTELKPDILITDIRMPIMDGMALLEALRENGSKVKVIIISGYGEFELAQKALRLNAAEYLLKPTSKEDVEAALKKIVSDIKLEDQERSEKSINEIGSSDSGVVSLVKDYVQSNYHQSIYLKDISKLIFLSENYLSTLFKKGTGVTFKEYLISVRMKKAKAFLAKPGLKIYEVAGLVGYESNEYFSNIFKETFGLTPKEYRSNCMKGVKR